MREMERAPLCSNQDSAGPVLQSAVFYIQSTHFQRRNALGFFFFVSITESPTIQKSLLWSSVEADQSKLPSLDSLQLFGEFWRRFNNNRLRRH